VGDACDDEVSYNLVAPPESVLMSYIPVTTTFCNNTNAAITITKLDCHGNATFTVIDTATNIRVDSIDVIKTSYAIDGGDVITVAPGTCAPALDCNLANIYPPEAGILVGGNYSVTATYSNYIQGGWRAIHSTTQVTINVRRYTFDGFFAPGESAKV
jgi:hypothetical protein